MSLIDDSREILAIWLKDGDTCWTVGCHYVTKIIPYRELGDMGYCLWFEIWVRDEILIRQNGAFVESVKYKVV